MDDLQRPGYCRDEMLEFLDGLRDSGAINMLGASPYLMQEFALDRVRAASVLTYWIQLRGRQHLYKEE